MFGSASAPDEVRDLRGKKFASTLGVWRVRAGDRTRVLKLLALGAGPTPAWRSEAEVESPFYWRREVEVYQSDLRDWTPFRLPGHRIFERADGTVALWLEDFGDTQRWSLDDIAGAAARLASMAAPPQAPPWLARGWLRRYLEVRAERVDPGLAVWRNRGAILDRIDAGPVVLVHNDLHPQNLFRRDGGLVAIDWAFCGLGVPGLDAGILAADSLYDGFHPVEDAERFVEQVWSAYAGALAPELVPEAEFAYFAGNALRYAWTPGVDERFASIYRVLASAAAARLPSFA